MRLMRKQSRVGASLLEALIAAVVLLVALAALTSQATVGVRAATRARLQSIAITICLSTLAEQVAAHKLQNTQAVPVAGLNGWMVETRIEPLSSSSALLRTDEQVRLVSVTAWQAGRNEAMSKTTVKQVVRTASLENASVAAAFHKP